MIFTECLAAGTADYSMFLTEMDLADFTDPAMHFAKCCPALFADRRIFLADFEESQLEMVRAVRNGILQFFSGTGKNLP